MKTNPIRKEAGIVYYAVGSFVLFICLVLKIWSNAGILIVTLLWCFGWSAIGIGAGLINTRKHNKSKLDRSRKHYYLLYYPLAILIIFLTSLSVAFSINDGVSKLVPQFYSMIPLVGLVFGMYAEDFSTSARKILEKLS